MTAGVERCRYGGTVVWVPRGDLGGSVARRLADRVDLHFRAEAAPLLLDLRGVDTLDSTAVDALERCRCDHRGFGVVGRPLCWPALPLRLRLGIRGLGGAADLASALAATAARAPRGAEQRRHARIPVGIPVDVVFGGRTAAATLADLSPGGLRLERIAPPVAATALVAAAGIDVFGLGADPLARELLGVSPTGTVPALPVHLLGGAAIGARFAESRPPV